MRNAVIIVAFMVSICTLGSGRQPVGAVGTDFALVQVASSVAGSAVTFDAVWTTLLSDSSGRVRQTEFYSKETPFEFKMDADRAALLVKKVSGEGKMIVKVTAHRNDQPMVSVTAYHKISMVVVDGVRVTATGLN